MTDSMPPAVAATKLHITAKPAPRLAPLMRQSLQFLALRNHALHRQLCHATQDNPLLEVTMPGRASDKPTQAQPDFASNNYDYDFDPTAKLAANPLSLTEHVFQQIGLLFPSEADRAVAMALVEYLAPSGWLEAGAEAAAAKLGVGGKAFTELVSRLQGMEPAGLFARGLGECLALQLRDRGEMTAFMAELLDHLPLLLAENGGGGGNGGAEAIADAMGVEVDEVAAGLGRLRRLDPKPGSRFQRDEGDIYRPDIIVSENDSGSGFRVAINRANMPEVSVVAEAEDLAKSGNSEARAMLDAARRDAAQLTEAIAGRGRMLLALAELVVARQGDFIRQGVMGMRPFTMVAAAGVLGYHPSSITRLVKDKLVLTPRGMLELADFFSPAVGQGKQQYASKAVTAFIGEMLAGEDKAAPMSDAEVARRLADQHGVVLSRRAVAKRRLANNMPPAHDRAG